MRDNDEMFDMITGTLDGFVSQDCDYEYNISNLLCVQEQVVRLVSMLRDARISRLEALLHEHEKTICDMQQKHEALRQHVDGLDISDIT